MDRTVRGSILQSKRNDLFRESANRLWSQPAAKACLWCIPCRHWGSPVPRDEGRYRATFALRTFTKTEQKYSQIDKEALSIIWGKKKFHMYLFGRSSNLYTDHQPLRSIFHTRKSILVVTAARLQRYALFLGGVDYTTEYKNAKVNSNAAGLSRLPLVRETRDKEIVDPVGVFSLMQFDPLSVTVENVRRETQSEILFWLRCLKCPVKDGRTTLILHSTPILFVKMRSHYNQPVWCGE